MHDFSAYPANATQVRKLVLLALKPANIHAAVGMKAEDMRR